MARRGQSTVSRGRAAVDARPSSSFSSRSAWRRHCRASRASSLPNAAICPGRARWRSRRRSGPQQTRRARTERAAPEARNRAPRRRRDRGSSSIGLRLTTASATSDDAERHDDKREDRLTPHDRSSPQTPIGPSGFRRSRSSLPVLKKGTYLSSTKTVSPVRGLRPWRAARCFTVKAPKPRSSTLSPRANAPVISSSTMLMMRSTSRWKRCGLAAATF